MSTYITLDDEIVEKGLDELLGQYAESSNLRALLSIILEPYRVLESTMYDLFWNTTLDGAQGVQLDRYGRVVDEPRNGLADSEYRRFINVRLLVLYSQGEAARLRRIVALAAQSADVHYMNEPPASYGITFTVAVPLTDDTRKRILRAVEAATPSGVGFRISESSLQPFGFDDDDDAFGLDDGELAEELE